MAITQTRLLTLIKIAEDFKNNLLSTNRLISSAIRDLPPSPTPADLLSTIQHIQNINNSLSFDPFALQTLADEKAHFKQNAARNTRMALKARLKRSKTTELHNPQTTAPLAIGAKTPRNFDHIFKPSTENAIPKPAPTTQIYSGAAAPYSQIAVTPAAELPPIPLSDYKIELNKFYKSRQALEPYPDPFDDTIPLSLDHKIHLGLPTDEDDALF